MRITKYTVNCLKCGEALRLYPRHIEHKEPIPCPQCGRRNSADEFDLKAQMAAEAQALESLLKTKRP